MPSPKNVNSTQAFVNALNVAYGGGALTFDLSQPANIIGNGSLAPARVSITLDSTGKCPTTAMWFNDQLNPSGTTYHLQLFDSGGNFAADFGQITLSGASVDLSTLIPSSIAGGSISFPAPVLQQPSAPQVINGQPLTLEGTLLGFSTSGSITTDAGISRISADAMAFGNGSQGDKTANLQFGSATIQGNNSSPLLGNVVALAIGGNSSTSGGIQVLVGQAGVNATEKLRIDPSDGTIRLSIVQISAISGGVLSSPDTSISRIAGSTVAIGNGTQGDKTGILQLASVQGIGFQKQVFSSNGNFTISAGVTQTKATIVGAGGAGGGASAVALGTGGGSGGTAYKWLTGLTPGNTIAVTVGTGGTGSSGANGNSGGNSSIASGTQTITTVTANGGSGGIVTGNDVGGAGGAISTNGDINLTGTPGSAAATANNVGGNGGASIFGGGALGALASTAGAAGINPGSGGSGAGLGATNAGGAGANGIVIFEWVS